MRMHQFLIKTRPKLPLVILSVFLGVLLLGCDAKKIEKEQIAILKYATHPALDEMETAYAAELTSLLNSDENLSKRYEIVKFNANGNKQTAKVIAEAFNYKKIRLIMTIGTPAATAVAKTKSDIPFVYGAVADPTGAGILSERSTGIQNAGENVVVQSLRFIKAAFPSAKTIGTLYNPNEQNSVFVQNFLKENAVTMGFKLKQVSIDGTGQLAGLTDALTSQVDVIYSANDNTVNAGVAAVVSVCNKKLKPFVIGDLSTLSKGPLFAVGLEYSGMGKDLAQITFQVLKGKKITEFPPLPAPTGQIWVNDKTKKLLRYEYPNEEVAKQVSGSVR
jgi:putative ABC transport system substrate-binding protein